VKAQFLNCNALLGAESDPSAFKMFYSQVSKNASLKELKMRIIDHLRAAGHKVEMDDVRVWLYDKKKSGSDMNLEYRCTLVKDAMELKNKESGPADEEGAQEANDEAGIEENSGIEFPGQSIEPLLGSSMDMK